MADKLLLHTVDACTRTAGYDPLLPRRRRRRGPSIIKWYLVVVAGGVTAFWLWSQVIATMI